MFTMPDGSGRLRPAVRLVARHLSCPMHRAAQEVTSGGASFVMVVYGKIVEFMAPAVEPSESLGIHALREFLNRINGVGDVAERKG